VPRNSPISGALVCETAIKGRSSRGRAPAIPFKVRGASKSGAVERREKKILFFIRNSDPDLREMAILDAILDVYSAMAASYLGRFEASAKIGSTLYQEKLRTSCPSQRRRVGTPRDIPLKGQEILERHNQDLKGEDDD